MKGKGRGKGKEIEKGEAKAKEKEKEKERKERKKEKKRKGREKKRKESNNQNKDKGQNLEGVMGLVLVWMIFEGKLGKECCERFSQNPPTKGPISMDSYRILKELKFLA